MPKVTQILHTWDVHVAREDGDDWPDVREIEKRHAEIYVVPERFEIYLVRRRGAWELNHLLFTGDRYRLLKAGGRSGQNAGHYPFFPQGRELDPVYQAIVDNQIEHAEKTFRA